MRNLLTLLLLSALAGCASTSGHGPAFHQAVARPAPAPVARPPAYTPGYAPGTPAATVHTPAGAGASHGSLVPAAQTVPRSPNKRLLPPTKEVGLWAADGAPVATAGRPKVLGVEIPYPDGADPATRAKLDRCMEELAAVEAAVLDARAATEWPEGTRRCMAAKVHLRCVINRRSEAETIASLPGGSGADVAQHRALERHAWSLGDRFCDGVLLSNEDRLVLTALERAWIQRYGKH